MNRKFADLRQAPDLDPRVLHYDVVGLPQAVVEIGPGARRKTKGDLVLAEPGFIWALFFFPSRWYTITSVHDARGALVAHHVDLCVPPEERDGVLSFLDLKLDLIIRPDGTASWLDHDDYQREVEAGAISVPWQQAVSDTVAALDRERAAGLFPPALVQRFCPRPSRSRYASRYGS